ncbi:hypothetical protein SteCoe_16098 [Stentor coeruleus]|uniref:TOG domain-containing protein n=1 Tax=Stentor coeruleus TaxID=5963 RepID=A0A1R2C203_9CILI|nr:hypothetical protein SteCoe_16098 [Stentor coeruleus]
MQGSEDRPLKSTRVTNFTEFPSDPSSLSFESSSISEMSIPQEPIILARNERPLGGKSNYNFGSEEAAKCKNLSQSEFQGEVPSEELGEDETGPLEKRIESKVWKTRANALEELLKLMEKDLSLLSSYTGNLVKFISDSHPAVQEKGLDIFKLYIVKTPDSLLSMTEILAKILIDKGLGNAKTTIKQMTGNIILDFYAEQKDDGQAFILGLITCLENKTPKLQISAITCATSLIQAFGVRHVPYKTFLPIIEKHACSTNASLRSEALSFFKELYKWIRELVLSSIQQLKKPQQEELQKAFEETKDFPTVTRFFKCKGPEKPSKNQGHGIDIYEMAEAKDIFSKFPQEWVEKVLALEKWSDKKQALEQVNIEANYPKLADKNPGALIDLAKKLINDNNVNVMVQAVKLVGLLSKGLRKSFEIYSKEFFPIFLDKLKEKKTLIVQEVFTGLDNLLFSLTMDSVMIELEEALDDKATAMKINLMTWLQKTYSTFGMDKLGKSPREVALMIKKITDDVTASIRNEAFKTLVVLIGRFPEQCNPVIRDFPEAKMKKLKEFTESKPESAEPEEEKKIPPKAEKAPEKPVEKSEPPKKPSEKPIQTKKNVEPQRDEDLNALVSAEEAESILSSLLHPSTIPNLKETNWKDKQTGLQEMISWAKNNLEILGEYSEPLVRMVRVTVKDWKENNCAVCKCAFELVEFIAKSIDISRKAAYIVLSPQALEKLGDPKLSDSYASCLVSICEALGPKFVVGHIIKNTSDCTKPKLFSECSSTISKIIMDFGMHRVILKDIVDYCKIGLNQANPVMKKASVSLTITIYTFIGESIQALMKDIKEATMKALNEELSKVAVSPPITFKSVRGEEEVKFDAKKLLDNAIPRVNISQSISAGILKKLTDSNWKVRKEGLDDIEAILEQNGKRVLPGGLEELFKSIKAKLEDANKSIVRATFIVVNKLAESINGEIIIYNKYVVPGLLANLGDKQNLLRQDALVSIDKWAEETGQESIVNYAGQPLTIDNADLRIELLNWLLAHKDIFPKCDMKQMAPGILSCLQDRTANIRNIAETLFSETIIMIGISTYEPLLKDIKPAVLSTLKPIFDKFRAPEEPEETKKAPSTQQGISKSRTMVKKSTTKIVADHEVKTTRNKAQAYDIRILTSGEKEKRLDYDSRYKWSVEEIRPDYLDKLKEQIRGAFSPDLSNLLFNSDFKKQAEGAGFLTNIVNSDENEIIDYFDLIFKWSWIELIISSNTQIYKAVLELDLLVVGKLEELGYQVIETEANLILPVLCDKSGQNNVVFRVLIRNIIHSFCKIYPPEKVFQVVLNGVNSKNSRSKVECIEEIGSLVKDYGSTLALAKDVKTISKQVNSADNNVRAAAVNTIGEIFKVIGDKTWGLIGDLPDKAKGILEQRFKVKLQEGGKADDTKKMEKKNPEAQRPEPRKNTEKSAGTFRSQEPRKNIENKLLENTLNQFDFKKSHERKNSENNKGSDKHLKIERQDFESHSNVDMDKIAEKLFNIEKEIGKSSEYDLDEEKKHLKRKYSPKEDIRKNPSNELLQIPKDKNSPRREGSELSDRINMYIKRKELNTIKTHQDIDEHPENIDFNKTSKSHNPSEDKVFTMDLINLMHNLNSLNIQSQTSALQTLHDDILENLENYEKSLRKYSNELCYSIICIIPRIFVMRNLSSGFALLCFKTTYKLCSIENVVKMFNELQIFHLCDEVIKILAEDMCDKFEDKTDGEQAIKILNQILIKVLEFSQTNAIFDIMFKLLTTYKSSSNTKLTGILIKCILKLAKIIQTLHDEINLEKILWSIHEYLTSNELANEELGLKAMKTIVNEIVKILGEDIHKTYNIISEHHIDDIYITEWINDCLKALTHSQSTQISSGNKAEMLKDIVAKLMASKTYGQGVSELAVFLENNPNIDISAAFSCIPESFQEKILSDVHENKKQKPVPSFNSNDMLSRIAMMKQRYGLGSPSGATADLKNKVESLVDNLENNKLCMPKNNN